MLKDKHILIGITGGIAAYKVTYLIRDLKKRGAEVKTVVTESGKRFISELTVETLTGNAVYGDIFVKTDSVPHIDLARWADCFIICPATANFLAKCATGIADDLLSTLILSYERKVLFAPSMNTVMYLNRVTQENLKKIRKAGHIIIEPESGELACKEEGIGRLAEPETIVTHIEKYFNLQKDLSGKKILITAGRTEEPIDPVRYISNHSSGKMGYALAEAARNRGAQVTLISGPASVLPPGDVPFIPVQTARQMADAVKKEFDKNDILVMAAAVSDYRPAVISNQKLKKDKEQLQIELVKNEDILASIGKIKGEKITVGFSLETEDEMNNGLKKLKSKNLDLIVVNNPLVEGAEFGGDTNVAALIDKNEKTESLPKMTKGELAEIILSKIKEIADKDA